MKSIFLFVTILTTFALGLEAGTVPAPEIHVGNNLQKFLAENGAWNVQELKAQEFPGSTGRVYYWGQPQPGEIVLTHQTERFTYNYQTPVKYERYYPKNGGQGGLITVLSVYVDQSYSNERVYIVDGGIGHRNIRFFIEIPPTYFFEYSATLYGMN